MSHNGDNIYAENAAWNFEGEVPQNFSEHAKKSIPFYEVGHDLVAKLSDFFVNPHSVCYDLGCATGGLSLQLAARHQKKNIRVIGVDAADAMVRQAQLHQQSGTAAVQFIQADLLDLDMEKADLIVAYYTLQFIPPKNRQLIFDRIYEALNWGGAFILFEKVRAADARFQDIMTQVYTDYKLNQGYSAEEIVNKARSLKGVLEPFSEQGNLDLLKRSGFTDILSVFKYVCFEGFLAIK